MAERDWLGVERVEAPAAERAWTRAGPHSGSHRCVRGRSPTGRRDDRPRHRGRPRVIRSSAPLRPEAPSGPRSACSPATSPQPSAACARPGITPSATGRWASASSTTSLSPPRTPSPSAAPNGCWCSTGTSTTATEPRRSSPSPTRCCTSSIHQSPLYPGTGDPDFTGAGAGEGFTVNLPVAPGSGPDDFLALVQHVVVPLAREFRPGLLAISAGYDAHRADPARLLPARRGRLRRHVGRRCATSGAELDAPVLVCLEGGYDPRALAASVVATVEALDGDRPTPAGGRRRTAAPHRERVAGAGPPWPRRGRAARCRPRPPARPSGRPRTNPARSRPSILGSAASRWLRRESATTSPRRTAPRGSPRRRRAASARRRPASRAPGTSHASASTAASPKPSLSEVTSTAAAAFTQSGIRSGPGGAKREQLCARPAGDLRGQVMAFLRAGMGRRGTAGSARPARSPSRSRAAARGDGETGRDPRRWGGLPRPPATSTGRPGRPASSANSAREAPATKSIRPRRRRESATYDAGGARRCRGR